MLLTFLIFSVYVFLLPLARLPGGPPSSSSPRSRRPWAPPRTLRAGILVVATALASVLVTYGLFERYLNVLLPRGRLTGF